MKKQKKSKLNEFIQHAIDCESYGNNTVEVITELLQSLFEQITKILKTTPYIFSKGVYNQLLKDIEVVLEEYRKNVTSVYEIDIKDITSYQSNWMKEFLSDLGKAAIIPAYILSTVKFNPVANASNYKDLVDDSVYKIRQSVESSLRTAYITQEEMSDVSARFARREQQFEKNIIADTKVITTTAFSAVNYLMYKANKVNTVYCAILDSKTCIPCAELNGKEFEYKDQPILPQHHNCRCALIPTNALGGEEMPESFEQWFESLSEEEKIEAVGPERYKLYQAGVPVTKFVDNQNKQIPVKELKKVFNSEKSADILEKQPKVDSDLLSRVVTSLNRQGYSVSQGEDIDRYLDTYGKEAVIFSSGDVLFHSKLSTSGMYEEVIHLAQMRRLGYEKSRKLYVPLEIEAKTKLLKNYKLYGISDFEVDVVKGSLLYYKKLQEGK